MPPLQRTDGRSRPQTNAATPTSPRRRLTTSSWPRSATASPPASRVNDRLPALVSAARSASSLGIGTARMRPCSTANFAVLKVPDFGAHWITTVAADSPLWIRFRATSDRGLGGIPGGCSDTNAPPSSEICLASARCSLGDGTSTPDPRTAIVAPPAPMAARCAAMSMPRRDQRRHKSGAQQRQSRRTTRSTGPTPWSRGCPRPRAVARGRESRHAPTERQAGS